MIGEIVSGEKGVDLMLRVGVLGQRRRHESAGHPRRGKDGKITNTEMVCVISNNPDAYALKRAENAGVEAECCPRRSFRTGRPSTTALTDRIMRKEAGPDRAGGLPGADPAGDDPRPIRGRIINIHPSLIPSFCGKGYYGLKVHEEALRYGVKVTGATVHFVNEDLDAGPILLQKAVEVLPGDTPEILQRRVMEQAEWILLPAAIDGIANGRISGRRDRSAEKYDSRQKGAKKKY